MPKTKRATLSEVIAVPAVPFTKTWNPITHADLLTQIQKSIGKSAYRIRSMDFSLTENGRNMFGVIDVIDPDEIQRVKCAYSIGFRNSMQMTFAVGICSGLRVFVCDNLQFNGDFIEFRKHTSGLIPEELERLTDTAVYNAILAGYKTEEWNHKLHNYRLRESRTEIMTHDCITRGVFSPSRWNKFQGCLEAEQKLNGSELYAFHGAVTRLVRGDSLFSVAKATTEIKGICDDYITLSTAA